MWAVLLLTTTTTTLTLVQPLIRSCTVHDTYVYNVDGTPTGTRLGDDPPLASSESVACVAVGSNSTNSTPDATCSAQPSNNMYCRPAVQQCAVCGWFDPLGKVVSDYTLTFRKYCSPACVVETTNDNSIELSEPISFQYLTSLSVVGGNAPLRDGGESDRTTLIGPCPMLVFSDINALTIDALTIQCTSRSDIDVVSSGIVIRETTKLNLAASNILVMWYALSSLTVKGGKFLNTLPVVMGADMSASTLSSISIAESVYPSPVAVALGNFYGLVDVTQLDAFTKIIVQPVLPPRTSTVSASTPYPDLVVNIAAHPLNVVNATLYTGEYGPDYELEFYDPGLDSEASIAEQAMALERRWMGVIIVILLFLIVILHQDIVYYYYQLKAASA